MILPCQFPQDIGAKPTEAKLQEMIRTYYKRMDPSFDPSIKTGKAKALLLGQTNQADILRSEKMEISSVTCPADPEMWLVKNWTNIASVWQLAKR